MLGWVWLTLFRSVLQWLVDFVVLLEVRDCRPFTIASSYFVSCVVVRCPTHLAWFCACLPACHNTEMPCCTSTLRVCDAATLYTVAYLYRAKRSKTRWHRYCWCWQCNSNKRAVLRKTCANAHGDACKNVVMLRSNPRSCFLLRGQVRAILIMGAGKALAKAVTIATRYSILRRQGFREGSKGRGEHQVGYFLLHLLQQLRSRLSCPLELWRERHVAS